MERGWEQCKWRSVDGRYIRPMEDGCNVLGHVRVNSNDSVTM